jgi:hypothetical protein
MLHCAMEFKYGAACWCSAGCGQVLCVLSSCTAGIFASSPLVSHVVDNMADSQRCTVVLPIHPGRLQHVVRLHQHGLRLQLQLYAGSWAGRHALNLMESQHLMMLRYCGNGCTLSCACTSVFSYQRANTLTVDVS